MSVEGVGDLSEGVEDLLEEVEDLSEEVGDLLEGGEEEEMSVDQEIIDILVLRYRVALHSSFMFCGFLVLLFRYRVYGS